MFDLSICIDGKNPIIGKVRDLECYTSALSQVVDLQQKMTVMSRNPGTFNVSAMLPDGRRFSLMPVT
jgi:hypothetical protein